MGPNNDDIRQRATRVQFSYDINYADMYLFVAYNSIDHFNLTIYKWLHPSYSVAWNYLSIPKLPLKQCNGWSFGMDK